MNNEFKNRLQSELEPLKAEVQEQENKIEMERKQDELRIEQQKEKFGQNKLRIADFFSTCVEPLSNELISQLGGKSSDPIGRGSEHQKISSISIPCKNGSGIPCKLEIDISCSAEALLLKVRAKVHQNKFDEAETYPATKFKNDEALNWLETQALNAAKFIVENNRP